MEGETLVIRVSTQTPYMDRDDTAAVLGLPPERVRIVPSAVGGGFGGKLDISVQPLLGLATLLTGRPSRMTYTRRESMAATTKRHPGDDRRPARLRRRGPADRARLRGGLRHRRLRELGPDRGEPRAGARDRPLPGAARAGAGARAVHTNNPVAGAFRGFGVPQAAIAAEALVDRLADAAGIDRLEFRLRNAFRDGDVTATGQRLASVGIADCLEALRPAWTRALAEAAAANAEGGALRRGVGLACCWYGCGNTALPNPSTIRLGLRPDGTVVLHQGAVDIGQGSTTVLVQIAADALGLPVEAFALVGADTALTPDAGKTSASRQTFISGRAAEAAGRAPARRRPPPRQRRPGGAARAPRRRADRRGRPRDRPRRAPRRRRRATSSPPRSATTRRPCRSTPTARACPTPSTASARRSPSSRSTPRLGTVRLLRFTAAHDVGRAINPALCEGQIEGGIAQGIGLALMEEYLPGRTENLHDYLIPSVGDVPQIETILIEKPDPEGPFGARGLGEHALIPTAPAILNAIRHATGAEIDRVPALPHRVLAAIRAAEARR